MSDHIPGSPEEERLRSERDRAHALLARALPWVVEVRADEQKQNYPQKIKYAECVAVLDTLIRDIEQELGSGTDLTGSGHQDRRSETRAGSADVGED